MNDVCALVVTYNREKLLKECLKAIKNQTIKCDVFVVNNNSNDNTEQYLQKNNIDHETLEKNIGGAGGFNYGLKILSKKKYNLIWMMDDDTIPEKDALEKLLIADKLLKRNYGFLVSKSLWVDGTIHNMNRIQKKQKTNIPGIYKTQQATFVSLILNKTTIEKCGLPIKEFFIWADDIEYTRRVTKKYGLVSYYIENSTVIHKTKNNIGSKIAFDDISNINRYTYAFRNEYYLYDAEGISGKIYYILKCIYNFMRIILFSNNKSIRINVLIKGIEEGRKFKPQIEYL